MKRPVEVDRFLAYIVLGILSTAIVILSPCWLPFFLIGWGLAKITGANHAD